MEVTNSWFFAEKEVIHVTQIAADPTSARRNGASGSHSVPVVMSSCNCAIRLRTIYTDEAFADLFPPHGQPALVPWRLALVTVFQFMENLTDRQAADAVRDRLAWKYALSLELTDTGFDHTVLVPRFVPV